MQRPFHIERGQITNLGLLALLSMHRGLGIARFVRCVHVLEGRVA